MLALSKPDTQRGPVESYLHTLMLRDMHTRLGASICGVTAWSCSGPARTCSWRSRSTPSRIWRPSLGDSRPLYFATGAVPVLAFQYISHEIMKAAIMNRSLTYYPQVELFDVILARILVAIVTGFLAPLAVSSVQVAIGTNPIPVAPFTAMSGHLSAIVPGIGIGKTNVAIIGFLPDRLIGYALFSIILYISTGVMFLPSYMPDTIHHGMKFNPALQPAEWVRSAYYPYAGLEIGQLYVLMFGRTSASLGLLLVKHVFSKIQT